MNPGELRRGAGCPALEVLLAADSEETKAHLADCPACRAELALFRSFETPDPGNTEQADLAWIAGRLEKARPGLPDRRSWWHLTGTKRLVLAAACLVLAVAVGVQWNASRLTPLDQGGASEENLRSAGSLEWLEAPAGDIGSEAAPRVLRWTALAGATYSVELLQVDGTVAWKSGSLTGTSTELPEDARRAMEPRRRFILRVTAVDGAGKVVAVTPDASFRILPEGTTPPR